ncbi:MAG: RAD55 family ATPase [Promethearchaeota archaeon]
MFTDVHELIPQGYSLLLTGPEGSGKTFFSLQWIMKGCNAAKHGIYVTFDEAPGALRRRGTHMGWDLQDLEDVGLLTIIDGFYPRIGIKSKENLATRPDADYLLLKIAPLIEKSGTSRVVVDSITSLLIPTRTLSIKSKERGEGQTIKQRIALIRMSEFLKKQGVTVIFTEVETTNDYPQLEQFLMDGVIELKLTKTDEGIKRRLLVKKMREQEHPMHYIDFTISKEQGIVFK